MPDDRDQPLHTGHAGGIQHVVDHGATGDSMENLGEG
jgi:hypothetical protein